MSSSESQNNALELIATGEKSGLWGTITNTNLQILDRATKGVGSIALSSTTYSLTTTDYTLSEGHYVAIIFTGSPGGTCTVTLDPNDQQKVFVIKNNSDQTVVISQGSGSNATFAAGKSGVVYADGTGSAANCVDITQTLSLDLSNASLTGTLAQFNTAMSDGSFVSLAGTETLTNKTLTSPSVSDPTNTGSIYNNGSMRGNITALAALEVDCSAGNYFTKSISSNSTFTFANAPASRAYGFMLKVAISGAGTTISWPASVYWPNDAAPTWEDGTTNLFMFFTDDGGTTWRGSALVDYSA